MADQETSPAANSIRLEVLQVLPKLLWFLLALVVLWLTYKPLLASLNSGNVSKLSFASFQIEFAKEDFARAAERVEGGSPPVELKSYADRIERAGDKLVGAKVLWVTEQSSLRYLPERRALSSLGISFDLAKNNTEARALLDATSAMGVPYDFVITDIDRPADPFRADCFPSVPDTPRQAGCATVMLVHGYYPAQPIPVIVYSGDANIGIPPHALGGTERFDELVSLVLDAVERRQVRAKVAAPKS